MAELNANQSSQSKISHFFGKRTRESENKADIRTDDDTSCFSESVIRVNSSDNPVENSDEHERITKKKKPHAYLDSWRTNRPWLYTNDKKEMLCKFCIDMGKQNSFTTGNTNYRTSTLERHVDLPVHKQAILDLKRSEEFKSVQLNAFSKKHEALQRAMSVVYWLAKENVASLKYGSMVNFLDFHGNQSTMSSTSQKLKNFVSEPMGDKDVTEVAGIGPTLGGRLCEQGFDKAYVMLGQFLILKKDQELFTDWLKDTCSANKKQAGDCYQCLKDWCDAFL